MNQFEQEKAYLKRLSEEITFLIDWNYSSKSIDLAMARLTITLRNSERTKMDFPDKPGE